MSFNGFLIDAIRRDVVASGFPGWPAMLPPGVNEFDRSKLTTPDVPVYDTTEAAAWYWQTDQVVEPLHGDCGPLRPGFDASWWEHRVPEQVYVHHPDRANNEPGWERSALERIGALILVSIATESYNGVMEGYGIGRRSFATARKDETLERITSLSAGEITLALSLFGLPRGEDRYIEFGEVLVPIDRVGAPSHWLDDGKTAARYTPPTNVKGLDEFDHMVVGSFANAVLLGVGMSNVRNVRVDDATVPEPVHRKRSKRIGVPAVATYKTIRLPVARRPAAGSRPDGPPEALAGLKIVRGHTKTYKRAADGSGGLGRNHLEGTWWWHDRAVGDLDQDRPAPRYEVGR